jgi:uroporphyrinogen III methyltransferase/synthase
MKQSEKGKVFLVGAGPGDPGLLTLKAKECLEKADLVVFDSLANTALLDYAPSQAERIDVGKKAGCHTLSQEKINQLLVAKARQGMKVVRLKGGDPFIFGRGGEEALELFNAGIPFEIVPGVTSAIAVPAYAGIPLTHRDYTSSVTFITGHEDPLKEDSRLDWNRLANAVGTLVILMGVGNLPEIAQQLIKAGRAPSTPAAVIFKGTLPDQKTLTGTLEDITAKAEKAGLKPPAVILVGEVVALREKLNWFETKPLFGKRILVTRTREQAGLFSALLNALGAHCIEFPTIEIQPPLSWEKLDQAVRSLASYDWILFTSVNGVKYFFERLYALGKDVRDLRDIKIGAIGPQTSQAIRDCGIRPDFMPAEYKAEAMVAAFKKLAIQGQRVLIPRAAQARDILPQELARIVGRVEVVEAYQTVKPVLQKEEIVSMLQKGAIDLITFTSSSTVRNFMEILAPEEEVLKRWQIQGVVACIGPITAQTAREYGLEVQIQPPDYTIEALTEAILEYYRNPKGFG